MKQESYKNKAITDCQFVNFEDFLGFGLDNGNINQNKYFFNLSLIK